MPTEYVFDVNDGTAEAGRYPSNQPYVTRDIGLYEPSELDRVVIGDIADILSAAGFETEAAIANRNYEEACGMGDDTALGWRADDEEVESLTWLRQVTEDLAHVHVEWFSDGGVVEITIIDYWEGLDEDA